MNLELDGARVLVTAGASGIGLAITEAFVREGARVHICDIDTAALDALAATPSTITRSVCDVADEAQVAALMRTAIERLGGLDILINNAGIAGPTARCEDVSLADWSRTLDVNITGQFLCARAAIPHLRRGANASIVNLSSAAGRFGFPLRTPYAASKWAVIGLTKSLAIELGKDGIRVNAICPGAVAGDRIERVCANQAAVRGIGIDVVRDEMLGRASLRRFVSADDIANAAVFLCGAAGANISGQALPVDSDLQALA